MALVGISLKRCQYAPERWNIVEPINKPFDLVLLRELMPLPGYNYDFLWKADIKTKRLGLVFQTKVTSKYISHAGHSMSLKGQMAGIPKLTSYLKSASIRFDMDYAFCDSMV